jgi:Cdc6-like AAA superfamily ATPase
MTHPLLIAKNDHAEIFLLPAMANRHGLITGATGTGKTVTLQTLAEHFSASACPASCPMSKATCPAFRKLAAAIRKSPSGSKNWA